MRIEDFRKVIERREYVEKISSGEWAEGIEECQKKEVEILSEDVNSTIVFLKEECTADEYSWISEVIDILVEKTQSRELIECYKKLMTKFPEEYDTYKITECVEFAEAALSEGGDNG